MHGFIWDNEDTALEEWKNGYSYEGNYMSTKAITYTTKYMLKINERDKLYVPKIMCSAGIGEKWTEGIGAKRAKYVPRATLEEYRGARGTYFLCPHLIVSKLLPLLIFSWSLLFFPFFLARIVVSCIVFYQNR